MSELTAAALHTLERAMQTASMPLAAQQKLVLTLGFFQFRIVTTAKGSQHALHDLATKHHQGEALLLMKRHSDAAVAAEPSYRPHLNSPSACIHPFAVEQQD